MFLNFFVNCTIRITYLISESNHDDSEGKMFRYVFSTNKTQNEKREYLTVKMKKSKLLLYNNEKPNDA